MLGRHAERARRGAAPLLRIDARDLADLAALAARLGAAREQAGSRVRTLWVDEIDVLSFTAQRVLAEWIRHGSGPGDDASSSAATPLRWIATAGPAGLEDRLEAVLVHAFAPLVVNIPPLDPRSGEIARLAEYTARDFAEQVRGEPRVFAASALEALAEEPWWGDRTELEALLRTTLASSARDPIEASDLRFPDEPIAASASSTPPDREATPQTAGAADPRGSSPREAAFPSELPIDPVLDPSGDPAWRKLARSLSHEIRNPLVSIRTFTELLPEHYADETFRTRFKELVGKDVAHIQDVLARLSKAAERDRLASEPVDVSALIERLLTARRDRIGRGRLVVLCELERDDPQALGDADALEIALSGLIDRALDSLPERGDLFIASHRLERSGDGRPRLRVLLRHHDPQAEGMGGELDPVHHILEYVLAETIVAALGAPTPRWTPAATATSPERHPTTPSPESARAAAVPA